MSEKILWKESRREILYIPQDAFLDLITGKTRITNIPQGTRIHRADYDEKIGAFSIILEHEFFDAVPLGFQSQWFDPEVEKTELTDLECFKKIINAFCQGKNI